MAIHFPFFDFLLLWVAQACAPRGAIAAGADTRASVSAHGEQWRQQFDTTSELLEAERARVPELLEAQQVSGVLGRRAAVREGAAPACGAGHRAASDWASDQPPGGAPGPRSSMGP